MNERIKYIRKALKLNQSEFGARIGVKQNTITSYETGLRSPMDSTIMAIVKEFGVNEIWLRTGEGEPFQERTRADRIADIVYKTMTEDAGEIRAILAAALAELDDEEIILLNSIIRKLAGK